MTAINKFLLTFNILAAFVAIWLLTVVYNTHRNWSALVNGPKPAVDMPRDVQDNAGAIPTLAKHRSRFNELQAQYVALQETLANRKVYGQVDAPAGDPNNPNLKINIPGLQAIASVETSRDLATEENDRITNVNLSPAAVQNLTDLTAQRDSASQALTTQQGLLSQARDDELLFRRERDAIFAAMVAAHAQINAIVEETKPIRAEFVKLVGRYSRARDVASRFAVNIRPKPAPGEVADRGRVLASGANGLVVVSLGADDGVTAGQQMIVYRHGKLTSQFLGKIEIVSTEPEKSVGKVLPDFQRGDIERDDLVKRPE